MACVSRHFFGSKMNMSVPGAGIRRIHLVDKLEEHRYMGLDNIEFNKDLPFMSNEELAKIESQKLKD